MRLTTSIRDAFVNAAIADVPCVDYNQMAKEIFEKASLNAMPASVARILKDPKTVGYLATRYIGLYGFSHYIYTQESVNAMAFLGDAAANQLKQLSENKEEQRKKIRELKDKLKAVAYACNTTKQLAEALPEFVAYLPFEEKQAAGLPVVANVVSSFVKAGWPKKAAIQQKAA